MHAMLCAWRHKRTASGKQLANIDFFAKRGASTADPVVDFCVSTKQHPGTSLLDTFAPPQRPLLCRTACFASVLLVTKNIDAVCCLPALAVAGDHGFAKGL
jgi:hypothetical protein